MQIPFHWHQKALISPPQADKYRKGFGISSNSYYMWIPEYTKLRFTCTIFMYRVAYEGWIRVYVECTQSCHSSEKRDH